MPQPVRVQTMDSVKARFTDILGRTQLALHGYIRSLLGNGEDARDAVQDVFVDAWRVAQRGEPPFGEDGDEDGIRRWLFHVAYCRACAVLRRRGVLAWESLDVPSPPEPPAQQHAALPFEDLLAERDALQRALSGLEPEEAACLMLHVVAGFTSVEIARIAEVTPDATRKRLSRAMQRLRAAYFAQQGQHPGKRTQP